MDSPLLHVANVLYLASYSVRDILWLRVLTVLAMLCLGWCYWQSSATNALLWQAAFLAINLGQIGLLIYERRPVKLSAVEQSLIEGPLRPLTPRQVQRFASAARWQTYATGESLLVENTHLENLILLLSGSATVRAGGRDIATLHGGQFAGEMSFLTGDKTSAEVVATEGVLVAKWPERYITELMQREPELGTALQAALGTDLVRKLLRGRN